jgi:hypothetical protein
MKLVFVHDNGLKFVDKQCFSKGKGFKVYFEYHASK